MVRVATFRCWRDRISVFLDLEFTGRVRADFILLHRSRYGAGEPVRCAPGFRRFPVLLRNLLRSPRNAEWIESCRHVAPERTSIAAVLRFHRAVAARPLPL